MTFVKVNGTEDLQNHRHSREGRKERTGGRLPL